VHRHAVLWGPGTHRHPKGSPKAPKDTPNTPNGDTGYPRGTLKGATLKCINVTSISRRHKLQERAFIPYGKVRLTSVHFYVFILSPSLRRDQDSAKSRSGEPHRGKVLGVKIMVRSGWVHSEMPWGDAMVAFGGVPGSCKMWVSGKTPPGYFTTKSKGHFLTKT
jgi:hypothetical protein